MVLIAKHLFVYCWTVLEAVGRHWTVLVGIGRHLVGPSRNMAATSSVGKISVGEIFDKMSYGPAPEAPDSAQV